MMILEQNPRLGGAVDLGQLDKLKDLKAPNELNLTHQSRMNLAETHRPPSIGTTRIHGFRKTKARTQKHLNRTSFDQENKELEEMKLELVKRSRELLEMQKALRKLQEDGLKPGFPWLKIPAAKTITDLVPSL